LAVVAVGEAVVIDIGRGVAGRVGSGGVGFGCLRALRVRVEVVVEGVGGLGLVWRNTRVWAVEREVWMGSMKLTREYMPC
jgi:hypothetical protein